MLVNKVKCISLWLLIKRGGGGRESSLKFLVEKMWRASTHTSQLDTENSDEGDNIN